MARLGMLYSLTNTELEELQKQSQEDIYDYVLEEFEEEYFGTERACELDKAWYGLHYAFNNGQWKEDNSITAKIVFSGKFLLDSEDYIITLKTSDDIKEIVGYFDTIQDLDNVIAQGIYNTKAELLDLPKDDDYLTYLLDWSKEIVPFYRHALDNSLHVIFTVDL